MKIVAVVASPRGAKGATGALARIVLQGAESLGAETKVLTIRGQEVKPCKACDTCHREGSCPQKDSFKTIMESIAGADGLVLASPNYIFQVSAQMKAFFDRCCGVVHCQGFEGKYGGAVVTSGGGDEKPIADYICHFLAITGAIPVGSVWATMGEIQGYDFTRETRDKAFALGKRVVGAWKAGEPSSEYKAITSEFQERMRSLMLWRRNEWPYEYEYWKAHRGLKG
ncbi:MAG: flavodoxin family protein [Syntrophorhabdales bacterium]|jgi:multimeric flavodoxin WrbA